MAESNGHLFNTHEGIVAAVNERGIRIGEDWFNVSRFKPIPDLPTKGTRVRVTVDLKGYLSTITVLEQPAAQTPAVSSRDTTITRLAVLKAAASFLGQLSQTHEDIKSDHVLLLADRWLAWAQQPAPSDPSEEAF